MYTENRTATYSQVVVSSRHSEYGVAKWEGFLDGSCVWVVQEEWSLEVLLDTDITNLVAIASGITKVTSLDTDLKERLIE